MMSFLQDRLLLLSDHEPRVLREVLLCRGTGVLEVYGSRVQGFFLVESREF